MKKYYPHNRDSNWNVTGDDGEFITADLVNRTILMDIRTELQRLNAVFACANAQEIPRTLRKIALNTAKKRRKP